MQFWDRIKTILTEKKLTESELSKRAGITQASVNGWKTKGAIPRADIAQKVASYLGTTVEYLVTGNKPEGMTIQENKALLQLQSLTPVNQNAVFTLIDALYKQERGIL